MDLLIGINWLSLILQKSEKPLKIGLTLGKYSPFHIGYQKLIETALSEVDYIHNSQETINILLEIRANWSNGCVANFLDLFCLFSYTDKN